MQDRSAKAVQSGDLQRVAVAQQAQTIVEFGAAGLRAAAASARAELPKDRAQALTKRAVAR